MPQVARGEDLYLAHQAEIEDAIRRVCRRREMRPEDADEFASIVRLHLVESDYDALRQFQGRSRFTTYLRVIVERLALDYRVAQWGRWRPSARARHHGPAAVRLEQLVVRDGFAIPEAVERVAGEVGGEIDRARLTALAERFAPRVRRSYVGEEVLEAAAITSPDAERLLIVAEEASRFARVAARLKAALEELTPEDRLLVTLRFEQGMKVADIARVNHLDQKRTYRTLEHVLERLREILEAEGVTAAVVGPMLADSDAASQEVGRPVRLYERNTP
jgi:RNA polymerase sigma factor (sigma-70 family)